MKKLMPRVAVSLFFLGLLFYVTKDDLPQIGRTLAGVDRGLFVLSAVICTCSVLVLAKRLQLIFAAEDVSLRIGESANLTFVGYFFNNFLPTSVGGDIVKAMSAARITGQPMIAVTSVLMDRILGLFTFVLIPSVSLLFLRGRVHNPVVFAMVYGLLAASTFFFFVLFNRGIARRFGVVETMLNRLRVGAKARQLYDGLHRFKRHQGTVAAALLLSFVGQSLSIFSLFIAARAMGAQASPLHFYLLVPVVHLVSMLPSLNGLGIRESAYVYFLRGAICKEYAAAVGIVWLAFLLFLSLIGGVIYLVRHDYHIRLRPDGRAEMPEAR